MTNDRRNHGHRCADGLCWALGDSDYLSQPPVRHLLVQAVLTLAALLLFADPFQLLLYTGLAYWLFAGLTAMAVIVLRHHDAAVPRPFRVWGYPLPPLLFALAALSMMVAVVDANPDSALMTVGILAAGALVYGVQAALVGEAGAEGAGQ